MKSRRLITRIALIAAAAAVVFAVITLIRSIVTGVGVVLGCILVAGTSVVFAVCAIMLYVLKNYEPDDEDDEEEEDDEDDEERKDNTGRAGKNRSRNSRRRNPAGSRDQAKRPAAVQEERKAAEKDIESEVDELIARLEKESARDLSNFEEKLP